MLIGLWFNHSGSTHPKVGVVLMCIAKMFKEKARLEGSSSILVQEVCYLIFNFHIKSMCCHKQKY